MCTDCGCGALNNSHGDDRHILLYDLEQAAIASDTTPEVVGQRIADATFLYGLHRLMGLIATEANGDIPAADALPPLPPEMAARIWARVQAAIAAPDLPPIIPPERPTAMP